MTLAGAEVIPQPCRGWMQAAGISDMATAYKLIQGESGCNPKAVNAGSGACGLGQQLPCGKWPHQWDEPLGAMVDMQSYAVGRYKSWANAWTFWQCTAYCPLYPGGPIRKAGTAGDPFGRWY